MGSLVDLDLSSNPGKYIATRPQISENGTVTVLIQNKTPRNLQGVVLKIIYPDSGGNLQELTRRISGTLAAGKTDQLSVGITINPEFASSLKSGVVRAEVSNRRS